MADNSEVQTWVRVPGMACTREIFAPLDAWLTLEGVVVDVPLIGRSLDEASRALITTAQEAPGPVGVIGLSLGAIVTMAAAARAPDAFAALVLLSTNAREPTPEQRAVWAGVNDLVIAGGFEQAARQLSPTLWAPSPTSEQLRWGVDQALAVGERAFRDQLALQQSRHDLRLGLTNIVAPTLVVAGGADQLCPVERHREIARFVARADLREIAGLGHLTTVERPDLVAAAIGDWWGRRGASPELNRVPGAAAS